MKSCCLFIFLFVCFSKATAQNPSDSIVIFGNTTITLKEVVVNTKINVKSFIEQIENDSSFYKAFRNLRVLGFTAINDIRMLDGAGELKASLHSKTRQQRWKNCRTMQTLEAVKTGDIYNDAGAFNYYTARMYASLFFTKDTICGETNIVSGQLFDTQGKSGMEKHKEQLKMLFFNPGKRIAGLPFISDKTALFDEGIADRYDMSIDMDFYNNNSCYVFKQKVKSGMEDKVIIDEMTTWFNDSTFEVVARNYSLSYNAAVYDFKVNMEVQMTRYKELLVPALIRYKGDWKAIFKDRERGVFTATLFDFE